MCQEQVEKALQQSGKRITQQRKILLDVILNGDWECCKEIYYEAWSDRYKLWLLSNGENLQS